MSEPKQKPYRSKQNYGTPQNFIDATLRRLRIAAFMCDFAADAENKKATAYWSEADDSLSHGAVDWAMRIGGGWGWLNPPFTTIGPWAKKCREVKEWGRQIAFLVPAAVGSNWFRDHVDGHALVLLLNGRLAFMPDKPTWLYPKDCILCLYSPSIKPGYEVWNWRSDHATRAIAGIEPATHPRVDEAPLPSEIHGRLGSSASTSDAASSRVIKPILPYTSSADALAEACGHTDDCEALIPRDHGHRDCTCNGDRARPLSQLGGIA